MRYLVACFCLSIAVVTSLGRVQEIGTSHALLVGANWDKHPQFGNLKYAESDAFAMKHILEANDFKVKILTTRDEYGNPSESDPPIRYFIRKYLDDLLGTDKRPGLVKPNDRILIYFSGHGECSEGKTFYCPKDAKRGDLATYLDLEAEVLDRLRSCKAAGRFVIFDACRTTIRNNDNSAEVALDVPPGVNVHLACKYKQKAEEADELKQSRFTAEILRKLEGQPESLNQPVRWADLKMASVPKSAQEPVDASKDASDSVMILARKPIPLNGSFSKEMAADRQRMWASRLKTSVEESVSLIQGVNESKLSLRLVPPGEFLMGSSPDEIGHVSGTERRVVRITQPYFVSSFETTQRQLDHLLGAGKHRNYHSKDGDAERERYPADSVPREQALEFCASLNTLPALRREIWNGFEFRLPTEAEWEFACRAGSNDPFHFGRAVNQAKLNFKAGEPVEVKSYDPNHFGLYQMHGNVAEWCSDYYSDSYPRGLAINPVGPRTSTGKFLLRGGSYRSQAQECRAAAREPIGIGTAAGPSVGFRVVLAKVRPN